MKAPEIDPLIEKVMEREENLRQTIEALRNLLALAHARIRVLEDTLKLLGVGRQPQP
jgi:hypothetical protein